MQFINTRNPRRSLLAAAAALTVLAIVALLAAVSHADSSEVAPAATPGAPFPSAVTAEEASAADAAFRARFKALRTPGEAIPAASVIRDPGVDRFAAHEIDPADAALADAGVAAPTARLWVAARDDGTECLLAQPADAQGPAELCATLEQATGGYLLMTQSRRASNVELYGLLPDGVDTVSVTLADGSSTRLPVVDNAYAGRFDTPTRAIAFTDANGVEHRLAAVSEG